MTVRTDGAHRRAPDSGEAVVVAAGLRVLALEADNEEA